MTRTQPSGRGAGPTPPPWLRGAAVWVGAALGVALLVVLGVALLPGWWAGLVGGWVHGVENRGVVLGLAVGAAATLLPAAVAVLALRSGLRPRTRAVLVGVALLLLLPNVLTVTIALGRSDARSVLAVEAPGFRGATVVGIAVVVVAVVVALVSRWWVRRTRRSIDDARARAIRLGRERAAERRAGEQDPPSEGADELRDATDPGGRPAGVSQEPAPPGTPADRPGQGGTTGPPG